MHFRERGAAIQLVRSNYDPKLKRGKQEIMGRMPRRTLTVEKDVLQKLTESEKQELSDYVERVKSLDQLRLKLAAHDLPRIVSEATQYAAGVTDEAERDLLRRLFADAIVTLRRASAREAAAA